MAKALGVLLGLLGLVMGIASCEDRQVGVIEIELYYQAPTTSQILKDIRIIIGDDKYEWPVFKPGEEDGVTLKPDPKTLREVNVLFNTDKGTQAFVGRNFGMGVDSHKVRITINENARVSFQDCPLPCN